MNGARSWVGSLLAVWALGAWGLTSPKGEAAGGAGPAAGRSPSGASGPNAPAPGRGPTSLRSACAELVMSEARRGQASGSELERACADVIRADARRSPRARPAPGVAKSTPQRGPEARAAFTPGSTTPTIATAPRPPMGAQTATSSENLLDSDLLGAVTGDGINAEYSRVYQDRLSLVGRVRYSRTNASGRAATNIGIGAGFDYFLLGGENQGLRVGPRLEGSFGSLSTVGDTNGYGRLGLMGEVGYNLVSNSGLTGVLAAGFDLRLAGEQGTDVGFNASGNFSPYVRLGVGWAW